MKYFLMTFFAATLLFMSAAQAQTSIAVVDVDRILAESKVSVALNTKRDAARAELLSSLSKKEQGLRDQGKSIMEKRGKVTEEELVTLQKDYEGKLLETRKLAQKQKAAFEKASEISLLKLKSYISDTVQKIAQEKNYDLVISSRDVITGQNDLDITKEVLERMNTENTTIPFSMSE